MSLPAPAFPDPLTSPSRWANGNPPNLLCNEATLAGAACLLCAFGPRGIVDAAVTFATACLAAALTRALRSLFVSA